MKLSSNAQEIAEKRYFINGEDWEGLSIRVGESIGSNEVDKSWKERFANEIFDMNFIPGGRILRNAGRVKQSMLNCACLPIADSIESIGETIKNSLILWSYGAGIGIDFSPLREKGRPLSSKGGESSGMVSFLKAINSVAETIETGGQRRSGALAMLKVSHPEIFEFIDCKLKDKTLPYFNLSVAIDKGFISAVENDENWDLIFAGQKVRTVKAIDLWNKILDSMIKSGDPGLINYDNLLKNNSFYFQGIECTNLCQPKWATVLTKNGIRTIDDLRIGDYIWSEDGWVKVINKTFNGLKNVFRYRTNAGVFYGTKDHKIVSNNEKVKVYDAESIDILRGPHYDEYNIDRQSIMDGLVMGDGSIHKASNNLIYLCIGKKDYDYFDSEVASLIGRRRLGIKKYAYEVETNIIPNELPKTYEREIPKRYIYAPPSKVAAFLRGLFSANGSVLEKHRRVTLAGSSKNVIESVQIMLSSLGIKSYITHNKGYKTKFSNGTYQTRPSYDINITKDIDKFTKCIGFIQKYKMHKIQTILRGTTSNRDKITFDIISREFVSNEPVYDITVAGYHHTYWSGGCNVSNCGELPLPGYGMCCLGNLVLTSFIINKNTNWRKLANSIDILIRFLDDVLDINFYPIKQTEQVTKDARRLGLGVMGLHDYLIAKGVRYGSEESISEIEKLFKFIRDNAYLSSVKLAREKGTFPKYSKNEFMRASFVRRLPPKIRMEIKSNGIRNVCLLSAPPTGTSSLLADVSSGIEPHFSLAYRRKDRVSERTYIHSKLIEHIKSGEKKKPDWLIDMFDLLPEDHLEVQIAVQKYLDNSTSKTINCQSNMTTDKLSKLLLEYIMDAKGLTVYVDKSKEGQVLNRLSFNEVKKLIKNDTDISSNVEEDLIQCVRGTCEI